MELTVIDDNNWFTGRGARSVVHYLCALGLHDNLVVDAELAVRHAAQVGLHQYTTGHVRGQNLALWRHEEVDVLEHVQEQFITAVLDAVTSPADLTGHLGRDLHLLLLGLRLDARLRNERLQHTRVTVLRVPEVQDLVQQLVDEHEVVLDILLVDLAEVRLHHLREPDEELEHHGAVDVLLGDRGQPDVGSADVEERRARDVGDGRADLLARVYHVHAERVHRVAADIVAVHARYQHLALVVVHEQTADHGDDGAGHNLLTRRSSSVPKFSCRRRRRFTHSASRVPERRMAVGGADDESKIEMIRRRRSAARDRRLDGARYGGGLCNFCYDFFFLSR